MVGHLFQGHKQANANLSFYVICHDIDKYNILFALHDNSGYRGRDTIPKKVIEHYW